MLVFFSPDPAWKNITLYRIENLLRIYERQFIKEKDGRVVFEYFYYIQT